MIGALRHLLTLQRQVETPDGGGGVTTAWEDIAENAKIFAAIMPMSADESLRFRKLDNTATHRIKIRFRDDVTSHMRLAAADGTIYDIASVIDIDHAGTYLDILAVVRV